MRRSIDSVFYEFGYTVFFKKEAEKRVPGGDGYDYYYWYIAGTVPTTELFIDIFYILLLTLLS